MCTEASLTSQSCACGQTATLTLNTTSTRRSRRRLRWASRVWISTRHTRSKSCSAWWSAAVAARAAWSPSPVRPRHFLDTLALTRTHCCPDYEGQNVWDAADAGEWSLDLAEAAYASIQEVAPGVPGVAEGGTMKELCKFPGLILIVSRASIAGILGCILPGVPATVVRTGLRRRLPWRGEPTRHRCHLGCILLEMASGLHSSQDGSDIVADRRGPSGGQ